VSVSRRLALLCAAVVVLVYLPTLSFGWVDWDDDALLVGNALFRGLGWAQIRWAFTSALGGAYQPLAFLSYGLDFLLWGMEPRGYHLTSVLLHALNAGLFFLAAWRLLEFGASSRGPQRDLAAGALFAALVFALHPLRVESVSWVSERRDVLCGAFWLGAVLAYLRAREPGRRRRSLILVHVFFGAACLAKGLAVTLPVVLLVLDVWPLRRRLDECLREKVPMAVLALALGALAIAAQAGARASWSWGEHGVLARLAQSAYALTFYPLKTLWPSGLSAFYRLPVPLDPREPRFLLSAAAVAAVAAWSWVRRRETPWLAAAGAAYAVMLAPVSGLFQAGAQLVADRYSYLAVLPLELLAGAGLSAILARRAWRAPAMAAAVCVCVVLAAATVVQQSYWRDSETLWGRVLALDPGSSTGWFKLGLLRIRQGRPAEAAESFSRALASDSGCLEFLSRFERGVELAQTRRGLEIRPVCRKALSDLGTTQAQRGEFLQARRLLTLALAVDPEDAAARRNLARLADQPR